MRYRVWLADDGDPNHLVVYDYEVQDSIFEHWLQQFGPVMAWERLP